MRALQGTGSRGTGGQRGEPIPRRARVWCRTRPGGRRAPVAAVALTLGLTLAAAVGGAVLGPAAPAGATGAVTITQTPLGGNGSCVPTLWGRARWTYSVQSTPTAFRLTVNNPWNLCDPVTGIAAVYGMQAPGVAWPQVLITRQTFTIGEASTTVINFEKDCQPAQFDVLTGDTPGVIGLSPAGPFHGPLLFPGDIATAEQYHGPGCPGGMTPPSTTIPAVTTTVPAPVETTTTTTSTVPEEPEVEGATTTTTPQVQSATTIVPGGGGSSGGTSGGSAAPAAVPVDVADSSASNPSSPVDAALAITGAAALPLVLTGAALILIGTTVMVVRRVADGRR